MLVITYNEKIINNLANGVFSSEAEFNNFLEKQNPEDFLILNGFNLKLPGLNKKFISFTHTHGVSESGESANQIELVLNESQIAFPLEKFLIQGHSKEAYRKYKQELDALGGEGLPLFDKTKSYNTPYLYVLYSSRSSYNDYKNDISGPHKCTVHSVNVKASENQYLDYTISLTPIAKEVGDGGFIRRLTNSAAIKPTVIKRQGSSNLINLYPKVNPGSSEEVYPTKARLGNLATYTSELDIDFHLIIKDLLRSYIRSLAGPTHKNVIVLLPNINKVCLDKITSYYENSVYGYRKAPVDLNAPFTLALLEAQADEAFYSTSDKALQQYYVLRSFAEQLGVDIVEVNISPPQENVNPSLTIPVKRNIPLNKLKGYYKNLIGEDETEVSFNDKANNEFRSIRYKFVLDDTLYEDDDGIITYSEFGDKLKTFLGKLNSLAGLDFQWKMYTETNTAFNDFMKRDDFAGSDLLGIDNDDPGEENVIIFGERGLINNYLYGLGGVTAYSNESLLHPVDDKIINSDQFKQTKASVISNVNFFPIFTTQNKSRRDNYYKISKFNINENETYRNALDSISGKLLNQVQYLGITVPQEIQKLISEGIGPYANTEEELIKILEPIYDYYRGDIDKINEFFNNTIDELSNLTINLSLGTEFKKRESILKAYANILLEQIKSKSKNLNSLVCVFDDNLLISETEFQARLINQFNDLQLSISLTTQSPAFRLGSFYLIGKEAQFEVEPPGGRSRLLQLPKNYYILGYTHKMTGSNLESQFELVRKR